MQTIAILPAAGRSARMGSPKLLLPWGSTTVIEAVLKYWRASSVTHVIVTVHPDDHELAAICRRAGAEVVVAAAPPPDMKASVQLALEHAASRFGPVDSDAWLLAPADMPGLSPLAIDAVIQAYAATDSSIVVPEFDGRRGHPVMFPWAMARQVATLGEDEGINRLLRDHQVRTVAVAEASVLEDLDTPAEYARLRDRYNPARPT